MTILNSFFGDRELFLCSDQDFVSKVRPLKAGVIWTFDLDKQHANQQLLKAMKAGISLLNR